MLRISAHRTRNFGRSLASLCLVTALPLAAQAQTTLERIKQRGHITCGTSQGDDAWFDIVRRTVYATLNAEEFGLTQANVDEMVKSANPEIKRLLGPRASSARASTDISAPNRRSTCRAV